jgi:TonB family protein
VTAHEVSKFRNETRPIKRMSTNVILGAARGAWSGAFRAGGAAIVAAALWPGLSLGTHKKKDPEPAPAMPSDPGTRVGVERSGSVATKDGLALHLNTDLGSIRVVTLEPGAAPAVHYTVHIETDARAPLAQSLLDHYTLTARSTNGGVEITSAQPSQANHGAVNAQFFVQFELAVPIGYSLDITTGVGDIETQDIGGTAVLVTQGGNIRTGRIGTMSQRGGWPGHMLARLSTEGGHIQVDDVTGDLDAFTAGGHIVAGNISGNAALRTGGGHIRAGQIGGRAQLETDGGNITLKQAGSFVSVRTGGGQIDFGEVRGSVRAQTGGGGIRIITVSGPMEVESNGGSVCLTRVAGAVQAATGGGNIQAWISPDSGSLTGRVSLAGASQLSAGTGDIVVFLPKNLAATIDASIENGGAGRITADPALALNFQMEANRAGLIRAFGTINGGGPVLKLRTTGGKIRLASEDSDTDLRDSLIREQRERIDRKHDFDFPQPNPMTGMAQNSDPRLDEKNDWLEGWMDHVEVWLFGGLHEDSKDFFSRLLAHPNPVYPELARRAGIQGQVLLQVKVKTDGSVEVEKTLDGEPILAQAAKEAVQRWRARPAVINGTRVETISTVRIDFELPH